ncbi:hypothetical protein Pla22_08040 [Rubripirellula amarantea]|uniref:Uncharacterized protein n=1 Tax=Rubripirellula amarantea TaxID=2527999 RepID=A0A5C5WQU8_9BACT|nr:hypothetical protein [Rubripirellula amarantea]TWT53176.1 hypothetical protein Pla22_08040 [Rubripirellula amarantea]
MDLPPARVADQGVAQSDAQSAIPVSTQSPTPHAVQSVCQLSIQFVYDGSIPGPRPVTIGETTVFCGDPGMVDESLIVDPSTFGIANILVTADLQTQNPPTSLSQTHVIRCEGCRFDPHVVLARAGDSIEFANRDVFGHIVQIRFFDNPYVAVAVPKDRAHSFAVKQSERTPAAVGCQQFPWMQSFIAVPDSPVAGLSDSTGKVVLDHLPAGQTVGLRLWHELAKFDSVLVDGKSTPVERGRLSISLGSREDQACTIAIPPTAFEN